MPLGKELRLMPSSFKKKEGIASDLNGKNPSLDNTYNVLNKQDDSVPEQILKPKRQPGTLVMYKRFVKV